MQPVRQNIIKVDIMHNVSKIAACVPFMQADLACMRLHKPFLVSEIVNLA